MKNWLIGVLCLFLMIGVHAESRQFLGTVSMGKAYLDTDSVKPFGTNTKFKVYVVYSKPTKIDGINQLISSDALSGVLDCARGMVFTGMMYVYDLNGKEVYKEPQDKWVPIIPNTVTGLVAAQYCR
jgi:hypothetical protein